MLKCDACERMRLKVSNTPRVCFGEQAEAKMKSRPNSPQYKRRHRLTSKISESVTALLKTNVRNGLEIAREKQIIRELLKDKKQQNTLHRKALNKFKYQFLNAGPVT